MLRMQGLTETHVSNSSSPKRQPHLVRAKAKAKQQFVLTLAVAEVKERGVQPLQPLKQGTPP